MRKTYSFFDLAELFKLLTKSAIVGMPCKATSVVSADEEMCTVTLDDLPDEKLGHGC